MLRNKTLLRNTGEKSRNERDRVPAEASDEAAEEVERDEAPPARAVCTGLWSPPWGLAYPPPKQINKDVEGASPRITGRNKATVFQMHDVWGRGTVTRAIPEQQFD